MTFELTLALLIVHSFIIFQDFKERMVYWWLYLIFFIIQGTIVFSNESWIFGDFILNISFLSLQYFLTFFYFSLKCKSWQWNLNNSIGMGDLLWLSSAVAWFSFDHFSFVYFTTLISAMFWFLVMSLMNRKPKNIPLAGFFSLIEIGYIVLNTVFGKTFI